MGEAGVPGPDPADVHAGYQTAVSLWAYEGNLVWTKFNAFLVANSIVLAIYGLSLGAAAVSRPFLVGLPVAGLVLCVVWWSMTKRGFDYHTYWVLSARELEAHLAEPVQTIARGGAFGAGKPVSIEIDGQARNLRMSRGSRMFKTGFGAYLVIAVFAVLYVLMMFS